jgi:transmembrane sensor
VSLPDGSSVQLNTESTIEIQFTAVERGVRLVRGEAHFTVVKNPALPFVVRAREVGVRAVGTAFNVRLRPDVLEVLVTEGTVRVVPSQSRDHVTGSELPRADLSVLNAGEMAVIPVHGAPEPGVVSVITVPAADIEHAMSWHTRRLEYGDASLEEIIADFNRYNGHKLVIADARLAARRFGATFPAGDYDSLVRLLESTFGVIAERRENETVLRLR